MSGLSDDTSSDEGDSYVNMAKQKVGYNIEDTCDIIDESDSTTYRSFETSTDQDKSNNSGIFLVKKKTVRVLDSDTDSSDELEDHGLAVDNHKKSPPIPLSESEEETTESQISKTRFSSVPQSESEEETTETQISKTRFSSVPQSESEEETTESQISKTRFSYVPQSESEEETTESQISKTRFSSVPQSESEEETTERQISKTRFSSVSLSESEGETTETQTPKKKSLSVPLIEYEEETMETRTPTNDLPLSDDFQSSVSRRSIKNLRVPSGVEISQERNSLAVPPNIVLDHSKNDFSLSAKMRDARLSKNFQYNSTGILNSTANRSVVLLSDHDSDIIEVSSDESTPSPKKKLLPKIRKAARQQTLHSFMVKDEPATPRQIKPVLFNRSPKPLAEIQLTDQQNVLPTETVSRAEYESQWSKVNNLEMDYFKLQNMLDNINTEALPDKGQLIESRVNIAKNRYIEAKKALETMEVSDTKVDEAPKGNVNVSWADIEAGTNAVLPKTFGKIAMSTYNAQKAVTLDRLQQLHVALQTCPKEDDFEEDPKGIKVPLMPHQKRALAWMMFREEGKPSGGILADDMGLGKTLSMLSLIIKSMQLEESDSSDEENKYIGKHTKYNGGSLIVCPASLINQWSGEIDRHLKRGLVSYILYHGPKREASAKRLSQYDIVITTYAIINNEVEKQSAAFKIKWRRVILDEAHIIRNYKAQTSVACCQLPAKSRWALTGTPMHNKELDMYALLKFLRCSPFDDLQVWKRWVGDKSSGGVERLHTVISSLMLRRTKVELMEKGALNCMPEKKWELVQIALDDNEMRVYHKVLIFSQTLFAQFLHQRAEKNQDYVDQRFTGTSSNAPNQEYHKMRKKLLKLNKVKEVSQHEILVLLLRLRQICCHPSLITAMLDEGRDDIGERDEESDQLNLLDQLEKLNIEDDEYHPEHSLGPAVEGISQNEKITLKEASKGHLNPSDPVFSKTRASSKIKAMLKVLEERVISKNEKAIIVSQWSSYLKLVAMHLKDCDIEFDQLDGQVPVNKRMDMVNRLNNSKDRLQVLLLSLTAGGVGLNLVGANHLFLLDLHWNPQLERQAQDRIYRVGQTKPVFVYKFMATDTIEERIKALQDKKLAMAEGLLTGTRQATQSKLSLEDLKMIFGM